MHALVLLWTALVPAQSKVDPCTLVTKPEIQAAIEGKHNPIELASLKGKGIVWTITTSSASEGDSRVCSIHWQGDISGAMHERGDMSIRIYDAEMFKVNVSDMNRERQRYGKPALARIAGIGDEAYFFGYSDTGNPDARVGKLAVGIESLKGKPSVDLLKAAVSRLH
jgi:hypothetical protein